MGPILYISKAVSKAIDNLVQTGRKILGKKPQKKIGIITASPSVKKEKNNLKKKDQLSKKGAEEFHKLTKKAKNIANRKAKHVAS